MAKATTNETAAQKYERLKKEQFDRFLEESFSDEALKGVELYEVEAPSGMVFKCRRVDAAFLRSSSLPLSFMERAAISGGEVEKQKLWDEMSPQEKKGSIQIATRMVLYACVEPRLIVGELNGYKNALSVDELTMPDFEHLASWVNQQT